MRTSSLWVFPRWALLGSFLCSGVACAGSTPATEARLAELQRALTAQREVLARLEDDLDTLEEQQLAALDELDVIIDGLDDDHDEVDGDRAASAPLALTVRGARWCTAKPWLAKGGPRLVSVAVTVKNPAASSAPLLWVGYQLTDGKGRKFPIALAGCEQPLTATEIGPSAELELELPFQVPGDANGALTLLVAPADPAQPAAQLPVPAPR